MRHIIVLETTPAPYMPAGKAHRMRCRSCGIHSPWQSKENAEQAKAAHVWETTPPGWSA